MSELRTSELVATFMQHFAAAVATARLYPGAPDQPGLAGSITRMHEAAEKLNVESGELQLQLLSERFVYDGAFLEATDQVSRLATVLFGHGIERLLILGVPTAVDVDVIATVSTNHDGHQPLQSALDAQGVVSVRMLGAGLEAAGNDMQGHVDRLDLAAIDQDARETLIAVREPADYAASLLDGDADATAVANDMLQSFTDLRSKLGPQAADADLFVLAQRVLANLPQTIVFEFVSRAISAAEGNDFASGFLRAVPDPRLAELLVRFQHSGGPDALDIAKRICDVTGRPRDLVRLVEQRLAATAGARDSGTPSTMADVVSNRGGTISATHADAFAETLGATAMYDIVEVAAEIQEAEANLLRINENSLHDYLLVEEDKPSFKLAVRTISRSVGTAMADGETETVANLMRILDVARAAIESPTKRAVLDDANAEAVTSVAIRQLRQRHHDDVDLIAGEISPLGDGGLQGLFSLLAQEDQTGVRLFLLDLAEAFIKAAGCGVSPLHNHARDDRWYVVRNVVSLIGRLGTDDDLDVLRSLASHPHEGVRQEVATSLPRVLGAAASSTLQQLALDTHPDVAHEATTVLGRLSGEGASEALGHVAVHSHDMDQRVYAVDLLGQRRDDHALVVVGKLRRARPRLPRSLRKAAKAAHKRLGSS